MSVDIVEDIRRVREALIERHAGIEGYFKHCQSQDRARAAKAKPRGSQRPPRPLRQRAKS